MNCKGSEMHKEGVKYSRRECNAVIGIKCIKIEHNLQEGSGLHKGVNAREESAMQ